MKEKEPHRSIFSAEDSPVPLPSVEESWSDMRKRLDEEMPERALFFTWKRMGLLSILLLLSIGVFWFIERQKAGEKVDAVVKTDKTDMKQSTNKRQTGDPATVKLKAKTDEGRAEKTEEGRQNENVPAKRPKASIDEEKQERTSEEEKTKKSTKRGQTEVGAEWRHRENVKNGQKENTSDVVMKQKETYRREAGKRDRQQDKQQDQGENQRKNRRQDQRQGKQQVAPEAYRMPTTTAVADLPRPGRDPILIWVNMPKRAGVITRTPSGKEKKIADQPGKTKKVVPDDSTRILWAAGLQDSKSFPVGAQQPVDYNANLKKDIWFDYVPAPYFQYFISRKIGFQVALQFNNPQYTEAVSIFKKKGAVTGLFSNDTDIVVRKLYYLSLPLTVYYCPFRNFYLGVGLQFSSLSNGVAFQNNVIHYVGAGFGQPDTVTGIKLISLKEYRPAYSNLKKTDWRGLFEMNYYWRRLSLGAQVQQGLSDYLYTPVDGSMGKDKNSSFNVYLRYNLWERRIRN